MSGRGESTPNREEVQTRVCKLVGRKFSNNGAELRLDGRLFEDFGGDSVSLLELAMEIEDEFDLEIPDDTLDRLRTTAEIVSYLEARLSFDESSAET